jgi:RNA polymerase sigma-70 factor (ECF subfamily)
VETIHLVKKARAGDKEALLTLIMQQKQDYYRLAYTYMGNDEDAMDAMEDMIVIIYENIDRIRKPDAFYSWSKTILVNCCRKLLRKKKNLLSWEATGEESHEVFPQLDQQMALEKQLSLLNEKHREVLKLRYYLDLDYQQIADTLKIPLGTVKSRISTGLMKLAEGLGGEMHE